MHAINLKPMSSFIADKIVMDGLTYDDVLLIPAYSESFATYGGVDHKVFSSH